MRLTLAEYHGRRPKSVGRDGFVLRYLLDVSGSSEDHVDDVITMLDDAMRPKTKGHGVYQADYDDVRAAFGAILTPWIPPPRGPNRLRWPVLLLAIGLATLSAVLWAWCAAGCMLLAALSGKHAGHVWFELTALRLIFDWSHPIKRLLEKGDWR